MVDIARQPILAQRLPCRLIGLGLVLLALLVALIAALAVGGRQRLPAPFGLARNGLIEDRTAAGVGCGRLARPGVDGESTGVPVIPIRATHGTARGMPSADSSPARARVSSTLWGPTDPV